MLSADFASANELLIPIRRILTRESSFRLHNKSVVHAKRIIQYPLQYVYGIYIYIFIYLDYLFTVFNIITFFRTSTSVNSFGKCLWPLHLQAKRLHRREQRDPLRSALCRKTDQ